MGQQINTILAKIAFILLGKNIKNTWEEDYAFIKYFCFQLNCLGFKENEGDNHDGNCQ
jgi:hypothetical protein